MKTVKINVPDGYEICKLTSTFENIVFKEMSDKFQKVFEYHKTTKEQFNLDYGKVSAHTKAYEKECMLAAYYNKEWTPNWKNSNEYKYYPYFYMDDFRLDCVGYCCSDSRVPARLVWKNKADLIEALELFPDVFKESRN